MQCVASSYSLLPWAKVHCTAMYSEPWAGYVYILLMYTSSLAHYTMYSLYMVWWAGSALLIASG